MIDKAIPNPASAEAGDAWEGAGGYGLGTAASVIHDRIAHRYAVRAGVCAVEYRPEDGKASAEVRRLYAEAFGTADAREAS